MLLAPLALLVASTAPNVPARPAILDTPLPAVAAFGSIPDRDLLELRYAAKAGAAALVPLGACAVEDEHFLTDQGGCKDLVTGLVWGQLAPGAHDFQDAIAYCDDLIEDGYDDWFLPSKAELLEVAAHEGTDSSDAWHFNWTPFNGVQRSSTKKGGQRGWVVNITNETSSIDQNSSLRKLVCVREGTLDPGGGATAVHVDGIGLSTQNAGQGKKRGRAQVTILDDLGAPVQGAQVTGTFTGDYNETIVATTDSNGVAVLTTVAKINGGISFGFCVDDVAISGLTYDDAANVETCDSY